MIDITSLFTKENKAYITRILSQLEGDQYRDEIIEMSRDEIRVNIWLVLAHLAKVLKPERYLEIGVRRGYSMALVAGRQLNCELWGFDNWVKDYASVPNPGPPFVQSELAKIGYTRPINFVTGDSQETLPLFCAPVLFPLILVDGEHSFTAAYSDMRYCLRMLAPGGYMVVDDMHNPEVLTAWERITAEVHYPHQVSGWAGVMYAGD
jgi:predicted O-methyltransferase YrrM